MVTRETTNQDPHSLAYGVPARSPAVEDSLRLKAETCNIAAPPIAISLAVAQPYNTQPVEPFDDQSNHIAPSVVAKDEQSTAHHHQ